jgi:hypothetical protein
MNVLVMFVAVDVFCEWTDPLVPRSGRNFRPH